MKAKGFTRETIRDLGVKKNTFPHFKVGDTIAVSQRIVEGDKQRLQVFEGDVIAMHKKGASSSFTIRRIGANSVPVERIFPFNTPMIESITFVRYGKVRRAKLYYIRSRVGKASRVAEMVLSREQKEQMKEKDNLANAAQ